MITPQNLDDTLAKFKNSSYDKPKQDLTIQVKNICKESNNFESFVEQFYIYLPTNLQTMKKAVLAGIIIGIMLEKEYTL